MRKGQSRYNTETIPIYFVPSKQSYLPPEVFVDITDQMVPGVQPYYMISNYGRVWHKYQCKFLTPNIDSKGYLYKNLATTDSRINVPCRIHRLVKLAFDYRYDNDLYVVDHLDGIKSNCCIANLDWVNRSTNGIRAYENGLVGEGYTDEQVHKACQLLESGEYTVAEVAKEVGMSYTAVSAILGKRTHTDISDQYNIEKRKVANNLSENQVRDVCRFFQQHKYMFTQCNDACRAAMDALGLEKSTKILKTLQKIYTKQTYIYISRYYNF